MNLASTVFADLQHEVNGTRRVLERYPAGKGDFTPHPKSFTLEKLATHVASLPLLGTLAMENPELDFLSGKFQQPVPATMDGAGLVAVFDREWDRLKALLAATDDAALTTPWTLRKGDHVVFTMPRVAVVRGMVANHLIHHRAQLTLYYRMLDVPVPGLYGPSADEQ